MCFNAMHVADVGMGGFAEYLAEPLAICLVCLVCLVCLALICLCLVLDIPCTKP